MINQILEFFKNIFRPCELHDTLEEYIAARNPQNSADVDHFEQEYYRRRQSLFFDRYY